MNDKCPSAGTSSQRQSCVLTKLGREQYLEPRARVGGCDERVILCCWWIECFTNGSNTGRSNVRSCGRERRWSVMITYMTPWNNHTQLAGSWILIRTTQSNAALHVRRVSKN